MFMSEILAHPRYYEGYIKHGPNNVTVVCQRVNLVALLSSNVSIHPLPQTFSNYKL